MKAPLGIAGIAAQRLATRQRAGTNERVKEAQLAMRKRSPGSTGVRHAGRRTYCTRWGSDERDR